MFKVKKNSSPSDKATEPKKEAPVKKRHFIRGFLKYAALLLLILLLSLSGGLWWIFQTESGQHWLMSTANSFLAPQEDKKGLSFHIQSISGSLPFNFRVALEASDARGVWLSAPENIFTLNWKELPGCLHLSALKLINVDLLRFPELPADDKAPETSSPFGVKEFQELLRSVSAFLAEKHWWLPDIKLEGIEIKNALLPAGLIATDKDASSQEERLAVDLGLDASFLNNIANASLTAGVSDSQANPVQLPSFSFRKLALNSNLDFKPNKSVLDALLNLNVTVAESRLEINDFPQNLLGDDISLNLTLQANADTAEDKPAASITLNGPQLAAGHLQLESNVHWQSGPEWKNYGIDGKADCLVEGKINPLLADWIEAHKDSPLAMLRQPLTLKINAGAALPKADIVLDLKAPEIIASGHNLSQLDLNISTRNLDLPLPPYGLELLEKEHHCDISLGASIDEEAVRLSTQAFFQALKMPVKAGDKPKTDESVDAYIWLASLRQLDLSALGLLAKGDIQASIPPGRMPALDGSLNLQLAQWQALQKFIPDWLLSGNVKMDLHLDNAEAREPLQAALSPSPQNALLNLDVPAFAMRPQKGGKPVQIKNLRASVDLADLFASPRIDCSIQAARVEAEGMGLDVNLKAQGAISGPLNVELKSGGDINAQLAASWSPGLALLKNCDLSLKLPASLSPSGKAVSLGIHSENPASIHYGDNGVSVEKLKILMKPSGRLSVNGGLSRDKLGFKIDLDELDLKAWQILVPQIPLGYANLKLNLGGTPHKPDGNFDLSLRDVTLPGNPLPPFGLSLKGGIENNSSGSSLALRLGLDPKSLKSLGCDKSQVTARIPLLFAENGIPNVNMTGPLAANILWDGALGPIWNLLPMPDMRLNGRVAININAGGSIKAPQIKGGLSLNKARYEDLLLGILLTDINLKMDLSDHGRSRKVEGALDNLPGSVKLSLNASDGRGGTIAVNGGAAIDGTDLDIKANINRLRPLRRRDIHIELSGDASVAGTALAPVIKGQLLVNQGEILLNNLEIMGSVTTLPISDGKAAKKPESEKEPSKSEKGGSIDFRIIMLPRFTVEGRGLTSIWKANLLISGSPFDPSITGDINSVKGNFDFLGKNFSLTKGIVFFGGGSPSNPLLDMELTNETPDLTAHIIVSGPVNKLKIKLSSDPQLPRDEIISRVLFGRSVGDLSRFEALQLAAGVAQLAGLGSGDSILSKAKKALGVDVLRLGTSPTAAAGEAGDTTAGGTTVEMGKYINDMIYMGVQQGMKADSTAFIIEMELTPRTNLEIRTEQNNTWGGLKWKYNY